MDMTEKPQQCTAVSCWEKFLLQHDALRIVGFHPCSELQRLHAIIKKLMTLAYAHTWSAHKHTSPTG